MIDLRPGDWRDVLRDVESVDAIITDPPYSARTHRGHDASLARDTPDGYDRAPIEYSPMDHVDVHQYVAAWAPRCRGWICVMTDHVLAPAWCDALERARRYVFAPLPVVVPGSRVRLTGDGPSCWVVWLVVARPRGAPWATWGTLPGAYVGRRGARGPHRIVGDKPLRIMRRIVADYSRPGDLVCDPCAGTGTTLLAAQLEGRDGLGAEFDGATYDLARRRLAHLPAADPETGQAALFGGGE